MVSDKCFEVMDYTSDVKIKAYGRTMEELFENSAKGMFSLISEKPESDLTIMQKISIVSGYENSYEELLVSWLEKLLFYHETKKIIFFDFKIISLSLNAEDKKNNRGSLLQAEARGGYIDADRHEILIHIKGPTYHDLKIIHDIKKKVFEVNIIFDV